VRYFRFLKQLGQQPIRIHIPCLQAQILPAVSFDRNSECFITLLFLLDGIGFRDGAAKLQCWLSMLRFAQVRPIPMA
jgi:hypothetical protein